jgi:hypothetical protein
MDDARWERYAALGGFVFVVFGLLAGFLPGAPPAADDSAKEVAKFIRDHTGALQAAQVCTGVSIIALGWWFGSLFRRMRAAEGANPRLAVVATLGLAIGGSLALLAGGLLSTAALRIDELGDGGAQLLFTMSGVMIASSAFGVVLFLSAVCALNLRTRMFPEWTSYLGYLAAIALLIGGIGAGSDNGPINLLGLVGFLIWSIWILIISTMMWQTTSETVAA